MWSNQQSLSLPSCRPITTSFRLPKFSHPLGFLSYQLCNDYFNTIGTIKKRKMENCVLSWDVQLGAHNSLNEPQHPRSLMQGNVCKCGCCHTTISDGMEPLWVYLVNLPVGSISYNFDEFKDSSRVLQKKRNNWLEVWIAVWDISSWPWEH